MIGGRSLAAIRWAARMLSKLEYGIVTESSTGPEEFFVLVSSVYPGSKSELDSFLQVLAGLVQRGFVLCRRGSLRSRLDLTVEDLNQYIKARLAAGELLDEHPQAIEELSFEATDLGIAQLRPDDRPVPARQV